MLGYDLKQAFTYFFNKQNIAGIVLLMAILAITTIPFIGRIFSFLFLGIYCTLTNQRIHKPEVKQYTIGKNILKIGLLLVVIKIIMGIPTDALQSSINYETVSKICPLIFDIPFKGIYYSLDVADYICNLPTFVMTTIFFLLMLILAINLKFKSIFNFKFIKCILVKNFIKLIKLSIFCAIIAILGFIINSLVSNETSNIIPYISIRALTGLIVVPAIIDLQAQFIRKIFGIGQREVANA